MLRDRYNQESFMLLPNQKNCAPTPLPKFCPKKSCAFCESINNKITKNGTYPVKLSGERRQLFYCEKGEHSFSEMAYSGLVNKKGSEKEYIQTAKLIKEGLSCEKIADVKIRDVRTIEAWVTAISQKSQNFRAFYLPFSGEHN